jgi:hypothetical protein
VPPSSSAAALPCRQTYAHWKWGGSSPPPRFAFGDDMQPVVWLYPRASWSPDRSSAPDHIPATISAYYIPLKLTPRRTALLEIPRAAHVGIKFSAFYGTRRLITVFTTGPCLGPDAVNTHPICFSIDLHFLDLGTSWRWVVSFTPRPLYPAERVPGTHWIGGCVDPTAGLDDAEKRKFLTLPTPPSSNP